MRRLSQSRGSHLRAAGLARGGIQNTMERVFDSSNTNPRLRQQHLGGYSQPGRCMSGGVLPYSLGGGVPLGYSQPGRYMSGGYPHIVWVVVCRWVIVNQVGTCQGVLPYSLGGGVPLGYSQPGTYMSGLYSSGVSTSFEVGGWKTKVGGCEEARGQRPRGTRGVWGHAHTHTPWEIFEIWSVSDAFSSILAKKLRLLEHC